uniref:Cilia- and flagella-associated protein 418 n=1 Tax=Tetraselmis sp. GSL018 TaxID=582737 RepID=A0A061SDC5_9CHLO
MVGPPTYPLGRYNGTGTIFLCDKMRCTRCDLKVICFPGKSWKQEVDYMFLRNCYPDESKLSGKLRKCEESMAYSCQCSWLNCTEARRLGISDDIRWVCAGHP